VNRVLNERENDDYTASDPRDREISLGTPMLLGIFFALALLCAVFFGFGYSLGTKHAAETTVVAAGEQPLPASLGGAKPSAIGQSGKPTATPSVAVPYAAADGVPSVKSRTKPAPEEVDNEPVAPAAKAPSAIPPAPVLPPVPVSATSSMVQIAAVSHQEDADLLVSTLKRRGYNVAIHQEPQDKLLHVQVGPFPTRKDADVMRQKLLADGFNAIIK
jgi:DedD protein